MNILQKLGAQSFSVIGHGSDGGKCSKALTAALVLAMGATSGQALAAQNDSSRLETAKNVVERTIGVTDNHSNVTTAGAILGHVAYFAVAPEQAALKVGAEMIIGAGVGAATDSYSTGMEAAEITASLLGASIAGPVVGSYILFNQAQKTYGYYEAKQEREYTKSMDRSIERMDQIRQEEVLRIRNDERELRAAAPAELQAIEQKSTLERALAEFASGELSETIASRLAIEQSIDMAGGQTEPWYQQFSNHKLVAAHTHDLGDLHAVQQQTSLSDRFSSGLASMQAKHDERLEAGAAPSSSAFSLR